MRGPPSCAGSLTTQIFEFVPTLLAGAIIGLLAWVIATLVRTAIDRAAWPNSKGWRGSARFAILGLVIAMGLRARGIADDIVNLAN